jgi:hypothetical protein
MQQGNPIQHQGCSDNATHDPKICLEWLLDTSTRYHLVMVALIPFGVAPVCVGLISVVVTELVGHGRLLSETEP